MAHTSSSCATYKARMTQFQVHVTDSTIHPDIILIVRCSRAGLRSLQDSESAGVISVGCVSDHSNLKTLVAMLRE